MALNNIVTVNITRQTTSVAVASFNVPLILSTFATSKTTTTFTRARSYGSLPELVADGWATTDAVYKIAQAIFLQNPCVSRVVVGRADSEDATVAASMTAIFNEDHSWYGVVVDQAMSANFAGVAAWVEAARRFAVLWTTDPNTPDGTTSTDLASTLKTANYDRSAVIYREAFTDVDYPDASWMGEGFPFEPGSSTWAYKTLKGVKPGTVTDATETALKNKNCNYYTEVGGVNITQEGKVASGEFIDIIIGTDWIEARIREEVYGAFVNNRKVPYSDVGIGMIKGLVKGVLFRAAGMGILQEDSIEVTAPKFADIPQADKIARKLPNVKFRALYQGAIQKTEINGNISV